MLDPAPQKPAYKFDDRVYAIHRLRVNVASLNAEVRIIRREEKRCGPVYRDGLQSHRDYHLRKELRIAHLALACVRGKPYKAVERDAKTRPDSRKLIEKIKKFTYTIQPEGVLAWLDK